MTTLTTAFRRYLLLATLPAALAFSGCGKDNDNGPGNGRVMAVHAAASANVRVKVLVNNSEIGQLNYGQNSSYLNAPAGAQEVKINVAASDQNAVTQTVTIERDKNQSLFAYAPNTTANAVALLAVSDDLAAPTAGKAKIRLVHLGQGAASPVNLAQASASGAPVNVIPTVAFPTASAFVEITPGDYNFVVTNSTNATVTSVGNGTGAGTGTRNYAAGKIYTVLVRGVASSLDQTLQPRATVIENN
ncbi:hypothetical protein SAMN00120144_0549 [Hymenobacter roseosalivarius DSM 11622]|uniref:DUF4397 domain-containing protein n=1 Tax=Hymenobacter roseosalivarius DSM 11622 TaxID=645990 RepID=A0A1W1VS28_9BACT|nr:DUF4397 domain-containing protein [Hymenobacter roseosalivarius]SMB96148.1 hypothetical protein SAMN00120144_0549 [Hymenobacter roseosalivarius DSM 11622]